MTLWRSAQGIGLLLTVALLGALFQSPDVALRLLWDVAIPVLPAVFLINPALWRNVCPLGTLNMLLNRRGSRRVMDERLIRVAGLVAILLLALMVPARRFLFNMNGPVLAITILSVAGLAIALGVVFEKKAGFCSSICPVLPVEKLYGQSPLLDIRNARCAPCTMCTTRACIDIAQSKTIAQTLGRERRSHAWLQTSYGAFAAAFPGFVIGYNLTQDGSLSAAGRVYLTVAAAAAASYLLVVTVVRGLNLGATLAIRLLAALAIGLYYWFAAPVVSGHLALPDWTPAIIRTAALVLIGVWLWRADWTIPVRARDSGPGNVAALPGRV
jgi:hypothetical protein